MIDWARKILVAWACLLCAFSAQAAISVYTSGTTANYIYGSGSLAATTPSAALSGDLLIAQVVALTTATITPPTGWTLVSSASTSQNGVQQRIYYLNLSASPASSYTWTMTGNGNRYASATIYAVRGAAVANCGSAATTNCAGNFQAGGGSTINAPNVQSQPPTYAAGSLRMAFFASSNGGTWINPNLENSATAGVYFWSGDSNRGLASDGSYYLLPSASNGDQQTASMSTSAGNIGSTLIISPGSLSLTCVNDNFNRTTGLGSDWASAVLNGSFTPSIVSNRLRLTDTRTNESTAVSFQRLLPGSNNYVQLSFKYYGYNGSGADGIAVILSDASVTPQPGGFGGSLGYAPKAANNVAGFAGGWLGLGLDEFGNFSNRNDSGACAPGVTPCATSAVPQSVSIRGSANTYYWLRGTGTLGTSVSNSSGHLYRVTVDSRTSGQALVSVERDTTGTGNSYTTLINSFNAASQTGQAAIPSNFMLSLTGSTGASTNIHEIDDLQICAQSMSTITAIDHYEFTVNSKGLTCTPATVTVRACLDAACTSTYSGNANVTLLPTGGWVGGDTKTFAGSGASFQLAETTAGTYTIGVVANSSTPAIKAFTQNPALCSVNGGALSASNCSVVFSDAGLVYSVPTQTSGVTSGSITIAALGKDSTGASQTCTPAFANVTRNISLWSGYVNPATGTMPLTLNAIGSSGTVSSTTSLSTSSASPSTVPLYFDANGQATVTLNYMDAGQISLNSKYTGSSATSDSGLSMTGTSIFPVIPYGFCVDSDDSDWAVCSGTDVATLSKCGKYRQAGQQFHMQVSARAYVSGAANICEKNNGSYKMPLTPNFVLSGIKLASPFAVQNAGFADGVLGITSIDINSGNASTTTTTYSKALTKITNQTVSDVGVFSMTATGTYFSQTVSGSNNFGRFYPAAFIVSGNTLTNRADLASCTNPSSFTYLGEPLTGKFTLQAINAATPTAGLASNYHDNFAFLGLVPSSSSAATTGLLFGAQDTNSSTNLNGRLATSCSGTAGACGAWSNGAAAINVSLLVKRSSGTSDPAATAQDGPFTKALFGIKAVDTDGVTIQSPNYSYAMNSTADSALIGTTQLFYGRMFLGNANGTPTLALPVPAYAQYYNGRGFVTNTNDKCTQITVPVAVAMSGTSKAAVMCSGGIGLYGSLTGISATMNGTTSGKATLISGNAGLVLSKSAGMAGYLDMALAVPNYLKYNWDGVDQTIDANNTSCTVPGDGDLFDDNPRARIRFGAKSNDKMIYFREVY